MSLSLLIRNVVAIFLILVASRVNAIPLKVQDTSPPAGYYVIVAAYYSNGKAYAEKYAATFNNNGYIGKYAFFPEKKMFMVYLDSYNNRDIAIDTMRKVRSENIKEDAWVFVYKPEDIELDVQPEPTSANPATVDKPEPVPVPVPEPEPTSANPATVDKPEPEPEPEPETNPYEGMHPVFFNLHHGTSSDLVEGQIQVVDPDRTNVVNMLEANQWNYIDKPSNIHSEVLLVADLFGYRKINHAINLDEPEKDSTDYFIQVMNDSILVDFELVRYHRGDIFTMFNVYFFSHSSIMRPESVYELDQLLAMLNENPQLRIRLHGHTNGNSAGTMRYRPEDDHSLFTPSGSLEKTASAKTLSEERANVVKRYLIDKGVEPDRMEIKGWGGKRMLYKKTEEQAIKNVRVEVEIIEE